MVIFRWPGKIALWGFAASIRNLFDFIERDRAMGISSYEDLLNAANTQAEPQRLLFVFTQAELPDGHTKDQQAQFKAQKGGALTPVMCVDKLASERGSFSGLVEESRQMGTGWDIVFVACMPGKPGLASNSDEAEQPLKVMVKSIMDGRIGSFLAFNRDGELVQLAVS
jgi:hypothetical protein